MDYRFENENMDNMQSNENPESNFYDSAPVQPQQQPKPVETKPREDDIYFDDTPTSNKQNNNKENKIDLEDEYYDLDGF